MSIYHLSVKIIGRSGGRSAVAAAAYRSGDKLYEKEKGKSYDYSRKSGIAYSEIMLPENAPAEFMDREILWNSVEEIEKQSNAQFSREVEVAFPVELSDEERLDVLHRFVKSNFVDEGMVADFSIHDKGDGNPHAHIMLTTRSFKKDGSWASKEKKAYALDESGNRIPVIDPETGEQKIGAKGRKLWQRVTVQANDWNRKERFTSWRQSWADICNEYLVEDKRIDHRSFKDRGIELIPTVHEGYAARKMEREGIDSTRGRINRAIKATNEKLLNIVEQLREISAGKLGITEIFESNEEIKEIDYITVFPEKWTMQDIAVFEENREHSYVDKQISASAMSESYDVDFDEFCKIYAEKYKAEQEGFTKSSGERDIESTYDDGELDKISDAFIEVEMQDTDESVIQGSVEQNVDELFPISNMFSAEDTEPEPEPEIPYRKQRQRDLDDGFEL